MWSLKWTQEDPKTAMTNLVLGYTQVANISALACIGKLTTMTNLGFRFAREVAVTKVPFEKVIGMIVNEFGLVEKLIGLGGSVWEMIWVEPVSQDPGNQNLDGGVSGVQKPIPGNQGNAWRFRPASPSRSSRPESARH